MALILPNSIDNDTAADAAEVQHNFATIQSYVNTNMVNRDGSVALTAPLLLLGDPTQPNHAANKAYVDAGNATDAAAVALKVNKAGDTLTGQLKGITPVAVEDLTRKDYVDTQITGVNATIDSAGRGIVGYGERTSDQNGITTEVDIPGCSVTFTAVLGRRYKVTAQGTVSSTVPLDTAWMQLKTGGGALMQIGVTRCVHSSVAESISLSWVASGISVGSTTWKLTMARATGSGILAIGAQASYPTFILVEDIGIL